MASSRRVFIGFTLVHEVPANAEPAAQKGNLVHYLGVGRGESTRAPPSKNTRSLASRTGFRLDLGYVRFVYRLAPPDVYHLAESGVAGL